MPVHPQAALILEMVRKAGRPEYWELSPEQARANHEKAFPVLDLEPMPVAFVRDMVCAGPGGDIQIRVYWPERGADAVGAAQPQSLPGALLWLHGGGHVVGSIACYDALCRHLATHSGQVVASVGYRRAPDHKFPAAVEDTEAALDWLFRGAADLGVAPDRLAIGGDSAGANLAAVGALLARSRAEPGLRLRHQLLVYPAVAPWPDSASQREYAEGHLLTRSNIEWFQAHYLRDASDRTDWRFAPLAHDDLSGLPPTTMVLAECDPLHDEGLAYAQRLRGAGNQVEIADYAGMVHGFLNMGGWLEDARDAVSLCARVLNRALSS